MSQRNFEERIHRHFKIKLNREYEDKETINTTSIDKRRRAPLNVGEDNTNKKKTLEMVTFIRKCCTKRPSITRTKSISRWTLAGCGKKRTHRELRTNMKKQGFRIFQMWHNFNAQSRTNNGNVTLYGLWKGTLEWNSALLVNNFALWQTQFASISTRAKCSKIVRIMSN